MKIIILELYVKTTVDGIKKVDQDVIEFDSTLF